ncbi:unnamed protein product, partial [Closterium sp. NIES-53]
MASGQEMDATKEVLVVGNEGDNAATAADIDLNIDDFVVDMEINGSEAELEADAENEDEPGSDEEFGGGPESLELVSYVDADDAGDKQSPTSTGGYVFVYRGDAVSWTSQRIKCAMLSLTESEYVAATEAGKEGRRLRFLLAEFR